MKVLLGMGGRADGFAALDATIERTREAGDDLTVAILETSSDRDREEVAAEVRDRLVESDVDADVRLVPGHPGSELTTMAESGDFDRIVLGGGERSPMGKIDIGSVAEFVLLNAEVSVTLIR